MINLLEKSPEATHGKVGILTFHKCINYGSYWQSRCMVEGLRSLGYQPELLDYHCDDATWAEMRCAFQPTLPERSSRGEMRNYGKKVRSFVEAISSMPLSPQFSLHEPALAGTYDAIIVGSDEVWNLSHPWYGGKPIFYGVGMKTPRLISYAGSFGSYSCHWGIDEYWADKLKEFDSISVRDDNSYWLVRGSTGREPDLVLDPCLQFPAAAQEQPESGREPYALVYGHGFPEWLSDAVRRWATAQGLRLLSVGYRNNFADEQLLSAGPIEFAKLVAGSSAMMTNFFHGCVFALLNGKPFVTAPSEYRMNKVRDLALAIGASHRIVDANTDTAEIHRLLTTPPLPRVNERIAELRQQSNDYLRAALA
ncbi:polysaccharide pyruvyl transferase family protein [Alteripontixanthobacter muriae]|uniref:polysaccharide pyruvyl transferase family protein n=1 Tax=Alteripontixanthobacter muriae TaxID=2705546 RepID=UPI001E3A3B41|nr:polysaccharide pyruvyl transferase family protein [Alteripontixanthobacter muriae]